MKGPERILIADRDALVYVSAASVWEIAIKKSLGRLGVDSESLERELESGGMNELQIRCRHAKVTAALPRHHEDPFERLIIAQAQSGGLTVVTCDRAFRPYDVAVVPPA